MSQEYDNTNTGALFGNTRQREGHKDPDLQGKINIDGVERWLSAWFFVYEKDGKKKRAIRLVLGDAVEKPRGARKPAGKYDDGPEIPF